MVMTSDMIAAQSYAFQQQSMGSMQHAGMISQMAGQGGGSGSQFGENMMGSGLNKLSAYGAPVMSGAMSLAGLDPMSMGIRGAMAGGARFGMMGAVGGGLMGAGLVAAPLMAAQYAGTQMLQGAGQQQALNASLRQNYQFMGQSGRGFTTGGMRDIGQMMRVMSMQQGPGGEFTSMGELTQLSAKMSQMGMMNGVRDAKQFSEKFTQMIGTVKEVATAFSTNLEQALNVVNSMKQSGIFTKQGQISQQIRDIAGAGGLSTSEVTQMMNVGSQISRSIGGRGRAGAMAGMRAIGQVGAAVQMGTLTEEDIYNVTGLTGAEGKQAYAQRRMQQDAAFYSSSLGRRMVASMAGENGTIDMESMEDLMYGDGGGTGGTMRKAYRNLGRIGRANFIRNEGRIRGAMMEQFGGMGQALQARDWLESRGMDMNSDRAAIFLQRKFKNLSPDDVDTLLKEVKGLSSAMQYQRDVAADMGMQKGLERYRANTGLKGVGKKIDAFKAKVQGTLQQAGADFYSSGTEMINRFINRLTGDFEVQVEKDIGMKVRGAFGSESAGSFGAYQRAKYFGVGADWQRQGPGDAMQRAAQQGMFGGGAPRGVDVFKRSGDLDRFREAGWNLNVSSDKNLSESLQNIQNIQGGFREGYAGYGADQLEAFGRENTVAIREAMLNENRVYKGQRGLEQMSRIIDKTAGGSSRLSIMYGQANDVGRAQLASTYLRGAGMDRTVQHMQGTPEQLSMFNMSQFATAGERNEAIGDYMFGGHVGGMSNVSAAEDAVAQRRGTAAGIAAGAGTGLLSGIPFIGTAIQAYDTGQMVTGGKTLSMQAAEKARGGAEASAYAAAGGRRATGAQQNAAAAFMQSEKGMEMLRASMSSGEAAAEFQAIQLDRMDQLKMGKAGQGFAGYGEETKLTDIQAGEYLARQSAYVNSKFQVWKKNLGHEPKDTDIDDFVKQNSDFVKDKADLARQVGGIGAQMGERYRQNRIEAYRRMGTQGQTRLRAMQESGAWRGGALTGEGLERFDIGGKVKIGTGEAEGALLGASLQRTGAVYGIPTDAEGNVISRREALNQQVGQMEVSSGQKVMALFGQAAKHRSQLTQFDEGDAGKKNLMRLKWASQSEEMAWQTYGQMDPQAQRELANEAGKVGMVGLRREMKTRTGMQRRLRRAGARGKLGTAKEVASQLGTDLTTEELGGGDPEAAAAAITESMQFTDKEQAAEFQAQVSSVLKGGKGPDGRPKDVVGELRALQATAGKQQREKKKEQAKEDDPNHENIAAIAKSVAQTAKAQAKISSSTQSAATSLNSGITVYDGGSRD
jgi:hypothetical protein